MTDDQEDTGSMGYMPKTHALLAEKGLTFENSFVNLPLCAPSRASFLSGQSAHNTGIKANNPVYGGGWGAFKDKEKNALPVWLKKAGYKTALIGKYINRYGQESTFGSLLSWPGSYLNIGFTSPTIGNPEDWVPPGWDLWYAFTGTRARYYDYDINENDKIKTFGSSAGDYSTDVLKARAVRFIKDQSGATDPFFMLVATKAVHAQGKCAIPAPQHADAFKKVSLPFNSAGKKESATKPATGGQSKEDIETCYRAELQSLQSVDDLVPALVGSLQKAGSSTTPSLSIHPTTASCSASTGDSANRYLMRKRSRCRSLSAVRESRRTRREASSSTTSTSLPLLLSLPERRPALPSTGTL